MTTRRATTDELEAFEYELATELNNLKKRIYRYKTDLYMISDWRDRVASDGNAADKTISFKFNPMHSGERLNLEIVITEYCIKQGIKQTLQEIQWILMQQKLSDVTDLANNFKAFRAIYL